MAVVGSKFESKQIHACFLSLIMKHESLIIYSAFNKSYSSNKKNAPIHSVASEAFGLLKATTKVYVGAYCELILACLSHGYPKPISVSNYQNILETVYVEIYTTIILCNIL